MSARFSISPLLTVNKLAVPSPHVEGPHTYAQRMHPHQVAVRPLRSPPVRTFLLL
jgi:hypothetical protein